VTEGKFEVYLYKDLKTNFMMQGLSWKVCSYSAGQEIPHFYKMQMQKFITMHPILNQLKPFHSLTPYLTKIHL